MSAPEPLLSEHEQVIVKNDPHTGLSAIIAIHSTALGAAAGGTRFRSYVDDVDALREALQLSKAMTLKHALAGTNSGGGKAVIIKRAAGKTDGLLRAYGDLVESLGGRYVTACDVGTDTDDLRVIGSRTSYVAGRSRADGGLGETAELTALGVLYAMETASRFTFGTEDLANRTVNVLGVGKVGSDLVDHLVKQGAKVRVSDVSAAAVGAVVARHPDVEVVDPADIIDRPADVFAPCALGGVLSTESVVRLQTSIVCGAANNQLLHDDVALQLQEAGICYVPDYLANCGGVVQGCAEYFGKDFDSALQDLERVRSTTAQVLQDAAERQITTVAAADALAWSRIASAGSGSSAKPGAAQGT